MKTDEVFLELYKTLKKNLKEDVWRDVERKLFYVYLDPPDGCEPDAVWHSVVRQTPVPITYPRDDVNRAVATLAAALEQHGCVSAQDAVRLLRGALPHYGDDDLAYIARVAAKLLAQAGKAATRGEQLCVAMESDVETVVEEGDYIVVRFKCRDGKTVTYVISPKEGREEEEEEEAEEL